MRRGYFLGWVFASGSDGVTRHHGGRACPRPNPLIWRMAGSGPVVFIGEPGVVRFMADQMETQIGDRQRLQVDLWLRDEAKVPGQRYQMKKEAMLLLFGTGDIERGRVCTVAPLPH